MIIDILSIASSIVSIVLAVYAILFARKESARSAESHQNAERILEEIKNVALSNKKAIGYAEDELKAI